VHEFKSIMDCVHFRNQIGPAIAENMNFNPSSSHRSSMPNQFSLEFRPTRMEVKGRRRLQRRLTRQVNEWMRVWSLSARIQRQHDYPYKRNMGRGILRMRDEGEKLEMKSVPDMIE